VSRVRIGIIGGGLMGREVASALGRWFVLESFPAKAELTAVCDLVEKQREWFRQVSTVSLITADYHELLASPEVDVVYVAVPHDLHERIYCDVLKAGKDLLAEKPFGIDLKAARAIATAAKSSGRFVRCSSEFPFLPGAQRAYQIAREGSLGRLLEIRSGFHHSSDLDPTKPANWKRQVRTCGEIGVMGDLGMHTVHIPFRLGWKPRRVYAQLQKIYHERPDGKGGMAPCDTWDNALLHTELESDGNNVPLRFEMKRLAPGETNTWFIEILGTDGGVRFSTKEPKTLWTFQRGKEQVWQRTDLGFQASFPTITGGIFEPGFPDCFLQMWAAFLAERAGRLDEKFGCVTPDEAVQSHQLFAAALQSHAEKRAIELSTFTTQPVSPSKT
jgi:predicted dehydrogenase